VHENTKNMKLEVPPNDTTQTLWDAITRRVQWRRTSINVDPSVAASASTTASQPHTAPDSIFPEVQLDSPKSKYPTPPLHLIRRNLLLLQKRMYVPRVNQSGRRPKQKKGKQPL
jgi:hypothetical protein